MSAMWCPKERLLKSYTQAHPSHNNNNILLHKGIIPNNNNNTLLPLRKGIIHDLLQVILKY